MICLYPLLLVEIRFLEYLMCHSPVARTRSVLAQREQEVHYFWVMAEKLREKEVFLRICCIVCFLGFYSNYVVQPV